MAAWIAQLRAQMDALDPRLWPFAIAVVAGGVVWLWREKWPASFERIPRRVQALPAMLIAAALGGASGSDLTHMIVEAVIGGASGVLAVGGHHALVKRPKPEKAE